MFRERGPLRERTGPSSERRGPCSERGLVHLQREDWSIFRERGALRERTGPSSERGVLSERGLVHVQRGGVLRERTGPCSERGVHPQRGGVLSERGLVHLQREDWSMFRERTGPCSERGVLSERTGPSPAVKNHQCHLVTRNNVKEMNVICLVHVFIHAHSRPFVHPLVDKRAKSFLCALFHGTHGSEQHHACMFNTAIPSTC